MTTQEHRGVMYAYQNDAKLKCEQPATIDKMLACGMPSYGTISPGHVWSHACYYHFEQAKRRGWEWKK